MGRIVRQLAPNYRHSVLISHRSPLTATWAEPVDGNPHGNARAAMVAVGAISERATAAKAESDQFTVDAGIDEVTRRRDLRARGALRQVAAGIWGRRVKLQRGERQIVKIAHGCSRTGPAVQPAGAAFECINSASERENCRREIGLAPSDARWLVSC